jgi:GNAT superfamily N-acetyltransferase
VRSGEQLFGEEATFTTPSRRAMPDVRTEAAIRTALASDAAVLTALLVELDCTVTETEVERRLARLIESPSDRVFAAELDGTVVGLLGMHLARLLHSDRFARITAFIVTEAHRGRGVGEALLREAEAWALARGCTQIEVTSGDHHAASHGFYERHGYRLDDRRFVKEEFASTDNTKRGCVSLPRASIDRRRRTGSPRASSRQFRVRAIAASTSGFSWSSFIEIWWIRRHVASLSAGGVPRIAR